jgi:hypothetical protein
MRVVATLSLVCLLVDCTSVNPPSIKSCTIEDAKKLAIADFQKHTKKVNYQINASKDTIDCYYISIGIKVEPYRKEGDSYIIHFGGGKHYYFEKNSCKLLRVEIDQ